MVVDEGEGAPIEAKLRRRQKLALRIGNRKVVHHHRAVDRTLDPADTDLHPVLEFKGFDLVYDEPLARRGVEDEQYRRDQQDEADQHDADPFRDRPPPMAPTRFFVSLAFLHGIHDLLVRHQNACPIDT